MDAEALHDLTAAYALHALDPEEARAYEEHLARCERCRDELAELSESATSLAYAADGPAPPPALRGRILDAARAERENVVPLRPRWAVPAAVTAVAAVAAAIALVVWAVSLSDRLDRRDSALRAQERVAAILADPAANRLPIPEGRGTLVVTTTGEAALVLSRLDRARAGKTYELWVAEAGRPQRAGTFDAGGNVTAVAVERPVPDGATVMVTEAVRDGQERPRSLEPD
jgi:hypothetical protein